MAEASTHDRDLEDKHFQALVASLPRLDGQEGFLAVLPPDGSELRFIPHLSGNEAPSSLNDFTRAIQQAWEKVQAELAPGDGTHTAVLRTARLVFDRFPHEAKRLARHKIGDASVPFKGSVFEQSVLMSEKEESHKEVIDYPDRISAEHKRLPSFIEKTVPVLVSEYIVAASRGDDLKPGSSVCMTLVPIAAHGQVRGAGVWYVVGRPGGVSDEVSGLLHATFSWLVTDVFIAKLLRAIVDLGGKPACPPAEGIVTAFAYLHLCERISFFGGPCPVHMVRPPGERSSWIQGSEASPSARQLDLDLEPEAAKLLGFRKVRFTLEYDGRYRRAPDEGARVEEFRKLITTKLGPIVIEAEQLRQNVALVGFRKLLHVFGHGVGNQMKAANLSALREWALKGSVPGHEVRKALDMLWPLWGIGELSRTVSHSHGQLRMDTLAGVHRGGVKDGYLEIDVAPEELLRRAETLTLAFAFSAASVITERKASLSWQGRPACDPGRMTALFPFVEDEFLGGTTLVTWGLFELIRNACEYLRESALDAPWLDFSGFVQGNRVIIEVKNPLQRGDWELFKRRPPRCFTVENIQWMEQEHLTSERGRIVETTSCRFEPERAEAVARWAFDWTRIHWRV